MVILIDQKDRMPEPVGSDSEHGRAKTVAIIVPCRNEEAFIARCLDSLLANDYDRRLLDIVVVDGMSEDGTREIVADYARRYECIRIIDNPQRNKPAALNIAILATESDVVMRIDAHAVYSKDYIGRLVGGLDRFGADNIGGIRETDPGKTTWQRAVAIAISHPFAAGNAVYRTGAALAEPRTVDTVFCGCYRREWFEKIGLFNPKLLRTQDREFNLRLSSNGGHIVLDPTVRCTYYPRTGFWNYAKWVCQGAFWVFYASRFSETRMRSVRNWIPTLFVLWHVLAGAFFAFAPQLGAIALAPVLLYWVLATYFASKSALNHRSPGLFPILVLLFSTTHYGYGIGACFGMISSAWHGRDIADCSFPASSRKQAA